jgi:hypothetical protein
MRSILRRQRFVDEIALLIARFRRHDLTGGAPQAGGQGPPPRPWPPCFTGSSNRRQLARAVVLSGGNVNSDQLRSLSWN